MYGDGGDVYSISWRPGGDVRLFYLFPFPCHLLLFLPFLFVAFFDFIALELME
jgi:hypothetical protein